MTEVAAHPRVALLRGYPKQKKVSKQQVYSPKPVKQPGSRQCQLPPAYSKVPDEVAKWAKTPRIYKADERKTEFDSPPPCRYIDDLESEDPFSDPAHSDTDHAGSAASKYRTSHINELEDGPIVATEDNSPLLMPSRPSQEIPMSRGRKPVPSRPSPAPVLTRFLSEFINLCTGHATSSEYPRGHKYADRIEKTARSTRPPSRLGYNKENSNALDRLHQIAEKIDEEKRKKSIDRSHRYRREALLYGEDGEQDLADLGLSYSDDDEEENARLLFAKTINTLDSRKYFN